MPGTEKSADSEIIRLDQSADRRLCPLEQRENRKVFQPLGSSLENAGRGAGSCSLKADSQENDFHFWMFSGNLNGICRGVHGLDVPPGRPTFQETVSPERTGNSQKVTVAGDQNTRFLRKIQSQIDHIGRRDANRTSGAGEQLYIFRQDAFKSAAGDCHCVGAADFHETDRAGSV